MINKELIQVGLNFNSREEVFNYLGELVVDNGVGLSKEEVVKALESREQEGTTGMMDGFAIPHAKSETIKTPEVAVLKLNTGVEWDSLDGKPIQYIVALFIPNEQAGTTHLKLLSQIARLLMKSDFKTSFANASSSEELHSLIVSSLDF